MHKNTVPLMALLLVVLTSQWVAAEPQAYIQFDGSPGNNVEIPDPSSGDFSVRPGEGLTVAVWMRPDALSFPYTDGSLPTQQYVHWLGKGCGVGPQGTCVGVRGTQAQEWTFRIYSQNEPLPCEDCPRQNRISFYVFNASPPDGLRCQNEGIGSYFQDPVVPGEWIHVVGVADDTQKITAIYKNGVFRRCDQYQDTGLPGCQRLPDQKPGQCPRPITPAHGPAPLRIGHRDRQSYFQGALAEVRIWSRALTPDEVQRVHVGVEPLPDGLVAEYLLDEGTGVSGDERTIAHDTGMNGYHGTVFGNTWIWVP